MNKYDQPPTILMSDLRRFDPLIDEVAESTVETKPARFIIFAGDGVWALRDYTTRRDYPFVTRQGALACAEFIVTEGFTPPYSSPSDINAYGEPLENVEALA